MDTRFKSDRETGVTFHHQARVLNWWLLSPAIWPINFADVREHQSPPTGSLHATVTGSEVVGDVCESLAACAFAVDTERIEENKPPGQENVCTRPARNSVPNVSKPIGERVRPKTTRLVVKSPPACRQENRAHENSPPHVSPKYGTDSGETIETYLSSACVPPPRSPNLGATRFSNVFDGRRCRQYGPRQ